MSMVSMPGDEEGTGGVVAPVSTGGVTRNSCQNISIKRQKSETRMFKLTFVFEWQKHVSCKQGPPWGRHLRTGQTVS